VSKEQEVKKVISDMRSSYNFAHALIQRNKIDLSDQYKKINYIYYRMFCSHLESFEILIKENCFSSAILLLRTMLELHIKSYYFEFIEKKNDSQVVDFLDSKKDFPNFFKMTQALETVENQAGDTFNGAFAQFAKSGLASYEKFSLFSHGRGEFLRIFFDNEEIKYSTDMILEIVLHAKSYFETLTLLLLVVQDRREELFHFIELIKHEVYFQGSTNGAR
jgi:hypothetical protein